MPKVKDKGLPSTWLKNYPELKLERNKIFCRLCMKKIAAEKKYNVNQHLETAIHKQNKNRRKQQTLQESIVQATQVDEQKMFAFDLCAAMVSANIPLKKLENAQYKHVLEKYCNRVIPSESSLRKNYLNQVHTNVFQQIKESICNNYIWISVDETTDTCGRYIANLLVGILNSESATGPFLISCKELQKTNHSTIARFVQESLINLLIKNGKNFFLKAPLRIEAFKEQLPNVPLPPEPVLTRWGTWLKAAMYYAEHIQNFKTFVFDLPESAAISVKECQEVLRNEVLLQNLEFRKSNYWYVSTSIQNLEKRNEPLVDSVKIVEDFIQHTRNVRGDIGEVLNKKLMEVLLKNEGFNVLLNTAKLLRGETSDNDAAAPLNAFKYAPVTSVDVERSFSIYKNILTDRPQSFSPENLEKYLNKLFL